MAISPSLIAFTVILVIYITVGVFAAIGTAYVSKALLPPKFEQVFYAVYLAMIAGFYLAFAVYFGSEQAWRVEATAVLCFTLIALAGIRMPYALIAGYLLHGLWDVIHELHAHAGLSVFEPGQTTAIPLAYGVFCASYDACMAGYFFIRRAHLECRMDWSLGLQFGRITEKQIGLISRSQTSRSGPICWRDLRTADRLNG